MEKIITMHPAFDKRNPDPSKDYGVHGVELLMVLRGGRGAVQFLIYTNWHLPHVQEEFEAKGYGCKPMAADLGYHSPIPIYEGQTTITEKCDLLGGKPCFYDGSGLNAERVFNILLKDGSDGVWKELEEYYKDIFGELE